MLVSLTIPSDLSTPDTSKNGMNIIKILDVFWKKSQENGPLQNMDKTKRPTGPDRRIRGDSKGESKDRSEIPDQR